MAMPQVPSQIKTYGDLKKAVSLWIDRDDDEFVNQIPNFINFAEKEIYRSLRIPKFEREVYLPIRNGMAFIPADCLEIKYIMKAKDGHAFRTTSIEELDWKRRNVGHSNDNYKIWDDQEIIFAQTTGRLYFFPPLTSHVPMPGEAENGGEVLISYYRDTTELIKDDESNEIMTIAPELMLYMALKHACLFVQDDDGAQKWGMMAISSMQEIQEQAKKMEYSGSPLVIPNQNDDSLSIRRRGFTTIFI